MHYPQAIRIEAPSVKLSVIQIDGNWEKVTLIVSFQLNMNGFYESD
jgi:hypothetical protein